MKVGCIQQVLFPVLYPAFAQVSLTTWTVPVAAAVVTNMQLVAIRVVTTIDMSAHLRGSATHQGIQGAGFPTIESYGRNIPVESPNNIGKLTRRIFITHRVFPMG